MHIKKNPNPLETRLFVRAKKYIKTIEHIPWIEMIAICNSLSMHATHDNSDIDLFIVCQPKMLWFVRFFVTIKMWRLGVWRHKDEIAHNFCLSFFVTSDALDFTKIAIENDIYLYYWIYYLKPIVSRNNTYEKFLDANKWVKIDPQQKQRNLIHHTKASKAPTVHLYHIWLSSIIKNLLGHKTKKRYKTLWKPQWVIISDVMLKFHDKDKRIVIRDRIVAKNFDK